MIKFIFKLSGLKISILITLVFVAIYGSAFLRYSSDSFLELLDKQIVDYAVRYRGTTLKSDTVAVVAIDTKSIDKYGQWPWKRNIMAKLLHELQTHYKIKVLGYDVVFSERDTNDVTSEQVLERFYQKAKKKLKDSQPIVGDLKKIQSDIFTEVNNDAKFGAELSKWGNIVLGYFFYFNFNDAQTKHLQDTEKEEFSSRIEHSEIKIIQGGENLKHIRLPEGKVVEANVPMLNSKNNLNGFFNIVPDREDGVIRNVPLIIRHNGMYFPSLALQMVRLYYDNPPIKMVVNEGGIEAVYLGKKRINTASDGSIMINFRGNAFTFPNYSVYDIINHNIPLEKLKGKMVLLGATEMGLYDLRITPFGTVFPGVEVHANAIDNLINDDYFYRSDFVHFLSFLLILFSGLFVGIVLPKLRALSGLIFSVLFLLGYFTTNLWFLYNEGSWTSFVYVLGVILLNWFAIVMYRFFGEEKDKRFIKGAFSQYLSPKVIEKLVNDPSMLKLGGEKREMTAFFSDIQGFSTISESLTPEELVVLLNEYLTAMTDIIMKYDGTIDKFEGDAIIAFFGAPIAYPDHATRACMASIEMQEKLAEMRIKWKKQDKPELYVRMGINTGEMVVGNMGSAYRMDYTIMGDAVNLASRLEGVNKQYKTEVLISEFSFEQVKDTIAARELDLIRVVGKNEPIRIYEVQSKVSDVSPKKKKANQFFSKGLEFYRQQKWEEAAKYFIHTNKLLVGDGASKVFFNRCKGYKKNNPGKNWDGVFQMINK